MIYSVPELKRILDPIRISGDANDLPGTDQVLIDSREVFRPEHTLFVALKGSWTDGHDFIPALYEKGVRCFLVSKDPGQFACPGACMIQVENTLDALQRIAAYHRSRFQIPVIGITGSNGKTIIKEWLYQLLKLDYHICRSPKSYNSQIGVPLSVCQLMPFHDLAIFEAGISRRGEMERLEPMIHCQTGLFTNIGPAHDEGFSSREEKVLEKLKLFVGSQTIICCLDHDAVYSLIRDTYPQKRLLTWSRFNPSADLLIRCVPATTRHHTLARVSGIFGQFEVTIPYEDDASLENALHCLTVMLHLGIAPDMIARRMKHLDPVAMRLEVKEGYANSRIINDSYNADPAGLEAVLQFTGKQYPGRKICAILSDFLESRESETDLARQIAALLIRYGIGRLIGIGSNILKVRDFLPPEISSDFYPETADFLEKMQAADFSGEVVVLKGARKFRLERIAQRLNRQIHATTLEINLHAFRQNLRTFHSLLNPGTRMMAMVKASAYGSGAEEVAKLLDAEGVGHLCVAYTDEGIALRQEGVRLPIVIMNPEPGQWENVFRFDLEPEIYSLELLASFLEAASEWNQQVSIHIKVDTGMHRLGFLESDWEMIGAHLGKYPQVRVASVFSHLAASDDPAHDEFTHQQAGIFMRFWENLSHKLGYRPARHLLNSAGIVRFPQYQFEMVRLGIGLYGIDQTGVIQEQLQNVFSLKARISQIRELESGESVGYSRAAIVSRKSRVATINIGYADGFLRAAGYGRYSVLIRRKKAPTLGSICMDMFMADVTDIPEAAVGDEVTIFGDSLPVKELAKCLSTIPYEVLTNVSQRVSRVYFQE